MQTSTLIRARAFRPEFLPSPLAVGSYILSAPDAIAVESTLPLVVLTTFGQRIIPNDLTPAHLHITVPPPEGATSISGTVDFSGEIGIKTRGSSTGGRAKASFSLELWGTRQEDTDASLLGMPSDSDWVLYGPYNFDRALMRNSFIYELSNQIGRYAPRTRFCEVLLNRGAGTLTAENYYGIYVLMEKIKRGEERVDVATLRTGDLEEPAISGGYILKIDRADPGDVGFSAGGQSLKWVEPKEEEMRLRPAQALWIQRYVDSFGLALGGVNFDDPASGYAQFIDVDAWIDHHIMNVFTKNPDAFVLSAYFHKNRGGKLVAGPIWDFDRAMGANDDARSADPTGWSVRFRGWWIRLFDDPAFVDRYVKRWKQLRGGPFSTPNLHAIVDGMAAELAASQARNSARWPLAGNAGGWREGQVERLKTWLADRARWIDGEFTRPPVLSPDGGRIELGQQVTLESPDGPVYYTLNGPDPSALDGTIAPEASLYTEPITIIENTRLRARTRASDFVWSTAVEEVYVTGTQPLVVTEIMYNPARGTEGVARSLFEFVEFQNVSDEPLDLRGIQTLGRLQFDFTEGNLLTLPPREHVVIVKDRKAFASRYGGDGIQIAGTFQATLSNFSQNIILSGGVGEEILNFTYESAWHPSTAGEGHSLVIRDPDGPPELWDRGEGWRASQTPNGSPGRADDGVQEGGHQVPGDLNQDGRLNLLDPIGLLSLAFLGSPGEFPCGDGSLNAEGNQRLLDVNTDAVVNVADASYLLSFLFTQGPPPMLGTDCLSIVGCPEVCAGSES